MTERQVACFHVDQWDSHAIQTIQTRDPSEVTR